MYGYLGILIDKEGQNINYFNLQVLIILNHWCYQETWEKSGRLGNCQEFCSHLKIFLKIFLFEKLVWKESIPFFWGFLIISLSIPSENRFFHISSWNIGNSVLMRGDGDYYFEGDPVESVIVYISWYTFYIFRLLFDQPLYIVSLSLFTLIIISILQCQNLFQISNIERNSV